MYRHDPFYISQILNLIKNSILAVAIGYADFVAVTNTTINQTDQAIEGVARIMEVYLFFSLSTSLFTNWDNKRKMLAERLFSAGHERLADSSHNRLSPERFR